MPATSGLRQLNARMVPGNSSHREHVQWDPHPDESPYYAFAVMDCGHICRWSWDKHTYWGCCLCQPGITENFDGPRSCQICHLK